MLPNDSSKPIQLLITKYKTGIIRNKKLFQIYYLHCLHLQYENLSTSEVLIQALYGMGGGGLGTNNSQSLLKNSSYFFA